MKELSFDIPDRDDRGVSPVIGVILMVAITVILAAVIASFVLGFGDQVGQSVQAGADISETQTGNATVTWIQEGNAVQLNVTHGGGDNVAFAVDDGNLASVGESVELGLTSGSSETVTVTVTAIGSGDTRTVVTQEEVTLTNSTS